MSTHPKLGETAEGSRPRAFFTTPIYYPNGEPHVGHAYTTVLTDVWARFWKLSGVQTFFSTGTDEHGQKIAQWAEKEGLAPQDLVDKTSQAFRNLAPALDAAPDIFIRTTEARHEHAATTFWNTLSERGHIYKGSYKGWYVVREERFFSEDELVDGKTPDGDTPVWMEEPCYFFNLSAWKEPLLAFYAAHPDAIRPVHRLNEILGLLKGDVPDLCISRQRKTCSWGVPVPGDDDHVMYVWVDALVNYLTVLGYPDDVENVAAFWPNSYHIIGKDILRFHAVHWPAMLMAAGFAPPRCNVAHGWWIRDDARKVSKSFGDKIDPIELAELYTADAVRFFFCREITFGQDGTFSIERLESCRQDLSNGWGNLAHRVLSFVQKSNGGRVPSRGTLSEQDAEILTFCAALHEQLVPIMQEGQFHAYVQEVWKGVALGNRYVDQNAPWKISDAERRNTVLNVALELVRTLAWFWQPILPNAAKKCLDALAVSPELRGFSSWSAQTLIPGTQLPVPTPLFSKLE